MQAKIIEDISKNDTENKAESDRLNTIATELRKRAALVYRTLYNRDPSDTDLKNLSASVNVDKRESA